MAGGSIEDRLAIGDLFVRYTTALDQGDVATVVDCFPLCGKAAAGTQFRHMLTNIAAEFDGDRARATAYLLVLITRDGKSRQLPPGCYECELIKQGGEWRFSRRVVFHDHDYTLEGI